MNFFWSFEDSKGHLINIHRKVIYSPLHWTKHRKVKCAMYDGDWAFEIPRLVIFVAARWLIDSFEILKSGFSSTIFSNVPLLARHADDFLNDYEGKSQNVGYSVLELWIFSTYWCIQYRHFSTILARPAHAMQFLVPRHHDWSFIQCPTNLHVGFPVHTVHTFFGLCHAVSAKASCFRLKWQNIWNRRITSMYQLARRFYVVTKTAFDVLEARLVRTGIDNPIFSQTRKDTYLQDRFL